MASSSLLALSALWILPNSPHVTTTTAWMTPSVLPIAATVTRTKIRCQNYRQPITRTLLASSVQTAAEVTHDNEESLGHLTVPELKEKLRSTGLKVTGKKSELIQRLITQKQISTDDITNLAQSHDDVVTPWSENIVQTNNLDPSLEQMPEPVIKALVKYTSSSSRAATSDASQNKSQSSSTPSPKLLPIQLASYQTIAEGNDCVLFSPTGTGKSLAFILPLAARLYGWKHDGVSFQHKKDAQKRRFFQQRRRQNNGNDSFSSSQSSGSVEAAVPSILVVEPSRELAKQVGKVWGKFHPTATKGSKRQVVTVFGGVPMQRHAALLGSKTDVVIGTPGRIRELIREKYLSTEHVRSIVLDEADTLLNFGDNPEVEWLLDGMQNDYQLVLASATVNTRVEKFVGEVMELEVGEEGYVVVDGDYGSGTDGSGDYGGIGVDAMAEDDTTSNSDVGPDIVTGSKGERDDAPNLPEKTPAVRHWSMPASTASRITLTSDLIVTMAPRRGIVFAPSKAEVEAVAQELNERLSTANDVSIHVLHGDMVQSARSRTVTSFRAESQRITRIMVATDVAARGLDLPAVDLVLQYGVPREAGKDGTYDSELYIHRTGRAGRFGSTRTADAILFYDRSQGEIATLNKLQDDMARLRGVDILPRQLPSSSEVMEASYDRVSRLCEEYASRAETEENAGDGTQSLVQYFEDKLSANLAAENESIFGNSKSEKESFLMHRLATAMAALSGLDSVVPPRSLLTSDPRDRTIRVRNESCNASNPLSPSEVTKVVKALGSGKLGRISVCDDGSAVFDLGAKKAERLLQNVASDADLDSSGWHFDMPGSLS